MRSKTRRTREYTIRLKQIRQLHTFCNYCLDVAVGNRNPYTKKGLDYQANEMLSLLSIVQDNQSIYSANVKSMLVHSRIVGKPRFDCIKRRELAYKDFSDDGTEDFTSLNISLQFGDEIRIYRKTMRRRDVVG